MLRHRLLGRSLAVGCRSLHLHEGISKQMLAQYGCTVQKGVIVDSFEGVDAACTTISGPQRVVKAQVLAGGRGKGTFDSGFQGGVHVCDSIPEVKRIVGEMLGHRLITKQTTENGLLVTKALIAECIDIKHEFYISLILDRANGGPMFVVSRQGGMDIEKVAEDTPDQIITMPVDILQGMTLEMGESLAKKLELPLSMAEEFVRLYSFAKEHDVLMLEINPFAQTNDNKYVIVDAKIQFDDSAAFRQQAVWAEEDMLQKDPREVEAAKWDLNYVSLDGEVGCLVNGAGLAMATMDIISMYGGRPANFLDVGGGATSRQVAAALKVIQSDPKVKVILVNIFGGIAKCDVIASGVIEACKQFGNTSVPLVVRLSGTNSLAGLELLKASNLPITAALDLDEAARKAVHYVKHL